MKYILALTAGLLLVPTQMAKAQDCADPSTTADQIECASADYDKADQVLNTTYKRIQAVLEKLDTDAGDGGDRAGKLLAAQRAWITFRDARCDLAAAAAYGGTLAPVLRILCLEDATEERTKQLDEVEKTVGP